MFDLVLEFELFVEFQQGSDVPLNGSAVELENE